MRVSAATSSMVSRRSSSPCGCSGRLYCGCVLVIVSSWILVLDDRCGTATGTGTDWVGLLTAVRDCFQPGPVGGGDRWCASWVARPCPALSGSCTPYEGRAPRLAGVCRLAADGRSLAVDRRC